MSSTNISFPAPVGGVPFERDFGPSILFSCLYAVLVLAGIYRFARSSSRTTVVLGTFAFVFERVIIFALRAKQSKTPSEDMDRNLTIYWQMTFAIGYLSMYADVVTVLRCIFVATTKGASPSQGVLLDGRSSSPDFHAPESNSSAYTLPADEDKPRVRFWYRRTFGILIISAWIPVIMGMVMGYNYVNAETNAAKASTVQSLRYATSVVSLILILALQCLSAYSLVALQRINRSAALFALILTTILNVIPIYHFVVMRNWTTSIVSTTPGSQNTNGEKAAFYLFQAAPEIITGGMLLVADVKSLFNAGVWGDRSTDPTPAASKV